MKTVSWTNTGVLISNLNRPHTHTPGGVRLHSEVKRVAAPKLSTTTPTEHSDSEGQQSRENA